MSEEEIIKYLKTIEEELQEENLSSFILNKDNVKYYTETLNLIDKLQKDNYKLDRENQHFFDRIQDLQKENKELKEDNKKLCAEISDLKDLLGE